MRLILFFLFFPLLNNPVKAGQSFAIKKPRTIGSAWQQAIRHVYIPTSNMPVTGSQEQKSQEPVDHTPTPEPEPIPEYSEVYDQSCSQQTLRQPSPEEMQHIFANLQAVLNSIDDEEYGDEDDAFFYDSQNDDLEYENFMQTLRPHR